MLRRALLKSSPLQSPQCDDDCANFNFTSLQRQLVSAREILKRLALQPGVVLADDAGLGKTWVAALTALTVAKNGGSVLIVLPGKTLQSKWETDIDKVQRAMPSLKEIRPPRQQHRTSDGGWAVSRSSAGGIVITTHAIYASDDFPKMRPDLVIVDEAHRSKHDGSNFKRKLQKRSAWYQWLLYLTATPFSIHIAELVSILTQVSSGQAETGHITTFSRFILDANKTTIQNPVSVATAVERWHAAVTQLRPWVMRTTIDQLPLKQRKDIFGERDTWEIKVPSAGRDVIEALVRADRLLSMAGYSSGLRGNDPRFHVGWHYLRDLLAPEVDPRASDEFRHRHLALHANIASTGVLAQLHADKLRSYLSGMRHEKIAAVVQAIAGKVVKNEKVVVFCHHIATARELRDELRQAIAALRPRKQARLTVSTRATWKKAWAKILTPIDSDAELHDATLAFVTEIGFHMQVSVWLDSGLDQSDCDQLVHGLKTTRVRNVGASKRRVPAIAAAVLDLAEWEWHDGKASLPGALHRHAWNPVIFPQSDNVYESLAIFGTPFGPDVLVATDKLSEGIDLHRYCRILVHYELDPSPVRVRQREGRVRRVGSWAARVGEPVLYAYPSYGRTRDEALVRIIRERLDRFDVLLGGAPAVTAEETELPITPQSQLLNTMRSRLEKDLKTCLNDYGSSEQA